MKRLAILGSGDLGQQVAHYAIADNHYDEVVFLDDFTTESTIREIAVIGKSSDAKSLHQAGRFDELIIAIGYHHLKKKREIFDSLAGQVPFGKIIHSTTFVDPTAEIGEGCVIYPGCSIDIRAKIGANSILNNGCTIAHDSSIGAHNFLSPRVAVAGFVTTGQLCNIGINATIIDNISLGDEIRLGGGTVVTKDLHTAGLYVGNPHRFIR